MSCRDTTPDPNNLFATQLKVESMADQMDKMQKELGTISDKMQKELGTISKNLKARDEKENKREQVDKENKEALKIALLKAPLAVHLRPPHGRGPGEYEQGREDRRARGGERHPARVAMSRGRPAFYYYYSIHLLVLAQLLSCFVLSTFSPSFSLFAVVFS